MNFLANPILLMGGSVVKNPPAKQQTWVWFLGWEDPLEKEKATHSSILAWEIPWTKESRGGHKDLDTTEQLNNSIIASWRAGMTLPPWLASLISEPVICKMALWYPPMGLLWA